MSMMPIYWSGLKQRTALEDMITDGGYGSPAADEALNARDVDPVVGKARASLPFQYL